MSISKKSEDWSSYNFAMFMDGGIVVLQLLYQQMILNVSVFKSFFILTLFFFIKNKISQEVGTVAMYYRGQKWYLTHFVDKIITRKQVSTLRVGYHHFGLR